MPRMDQIHPYGFSSLSNGTAVQYTAKRRNVTDNRPCALSKNQTRIVIGSFFVNTATGKSYLILVDPMRSRTPLLVAACTYHRSTAQNSSQLDYTTAGPLAREGDVTLLVKLIDSRRFVWLFQLASSSKGKKDNKDRSFKRNFLPTSAVQLVYPI